MVRIYTDWEKQARTARRRYQRFTGRIVNTDGKDISPPGRVVALHPTKGFRNRSLKTVSVQLRRNLWWLLQYKSGFGDPQVRFA